MDVNNPVLNLREYMYSFLFVFCNDTASTEIYTYLHTLSLHDALPFFGDDHGGGQLAIDGNRDGARALRALGIDALGQSAAVDPVLADEIDRKSTRLNSSH